MNRDTIFAMASLDDSARAEFANLAARALSAGLFGLSNASPTQFLDDLASARIHSDAVVLHRDERATAIGAGYLFRAKSESPWELRLSLEPAIKEDAARANLRSILLRALAQRCRELGVSMRHVRMGRSTPTAQELLDAGFREIELSQAQRQSAKTVDVEVALFVLG